MLDKLKKLLLKWIEPLTPRDRSKNITPLMIQELHRIYKSLSHGQKPEFIVSDLVPYLKKCGIKVNECGIGYVASL